MTARELGGALTAWLERLTPDAGRRERLAAAPHARFGADEREGGAEVRGDASGRETVSRHLDVEWVPEGAAALISARAYSSGEALAYHLQSQRLGPLAGESTPGAADHVTPIVLAPHVRADLPRACVADAVTGTDWEQRGAQPDIACDEAGALGRALEHLSSRA